MVLVTKRDEVVAELRPAQRQPAPSDDLTGALELLAESGEVTRAAAPKGAWRWHARGLWLSEGTGARTAG